MVDGLIEFVRVPKGAVGEVMALEVAPSAFNHFSMMPLYAGFVQWYGVECDPV